MSADRIGTLIDKDFDKPILYEPAETCNRLSIVTAFTDCERISTHMIGLSEGIKKGKYRKDLKVDIVLGMTKTSLSPKKHDDICRLLRFLAYTKHMPKLSCNYISTGKEVHSKVYVWSKDDTPTVAFCGSLNYTMNAFYKRREVVACCNPDNALNYYNELFSDTLSCTDISVRDRLRSVTNGSPTQADMLEEEPDYIFYDQNKKPIGVLEVSLLRADGSDTGYGSGINWGIRKNGIKRDKNQAYIPYNKRDREQGFFPDRIKPDDENCPMFKVITKDFGSFHMRMAQQGNKALHSVESNAILGEWIRKRIGAPLGGYITKQMLELYGRTYVTFRKYDDGVYLLDF